MCVCTGMCHRMNAEVKRQLRGDSSLLPPYRNWTQVLGIGSGHFNYWAILLACISFPRIWFIDLRCLSWSSLCRPGWPWIHRCLWVSASQVLVGLKACTTTPSREGTKGGWDKSCQFCFVFFSEEFCRSLFIKQTKLLASKPELHPSVCTFQYWDYFS